MFPNYFPKSYFNPNYFTSPYVVIVVKPDIPKEEDYTSPGSTGRTPIQRVLVDIHEAKTLQEAERIKQQIIQEDEELIAVVIAMVQGGVIK